MKKSLLSYISSLFLTTVNSQTINVPPGSAGTIGNILGGQQIDITKGPYDISMEVNGNHVCCGSIISD